MSICTEWDEEKYRILGELGVNREVLWRRNPEEMGVTGKIIRELITEQKGGSSMCAHSCRLYRNTWAGSADPGSESMYRIPEKRIKKKEMFVFMIDLHESEHSFIYDT